MPVTPDQADRLRTELTADEWIIVQMILAEAQIREVQRALGIGQPKVYRAIQAAEQVLGFRIRRIHGSKRGHGRPVGNPGHRYRPVILPAGGMPPGDRCPRCWLLEPHLCAAPTTYGTWMGEIETSIRERMNGGRR